MDKCISIHTTYTQMTSSSKLLRLGFTPVPTLLPEAYEYYFDMDSLPVTLPAKTSSPFYFGTGRGQMDQSYV